MTWTAGPDWSPDGGAISVERRGADGILRFAFIDPSDGTVLPTELQIPNGAASSWAPDGSALLVTPNGSTDAPMPQVLIDRATGEVTPTSWGARSYPSWQRVAP